MRAVTRTTLSLGDLLEIPVGIAAATGSADVKLSRGIRAGTEPPPEDPPEIGEEEAEILEQVGRDAEAEQDKLGPVFVEGVKIDDVLREIPTSELEWAKASTQLDRVRVLEFIDYRRVPTDRLAGSFWVQPDPGFERPLATLMAALIDTHRAIVCKFALKSRQRLAVIRPRKVDGGHALLLNLVVFADDWRQPDARVLSAAEHLGTVDRVAVEHAKTIIGEMIGDGHKLHEERDELVVTMSALAERAANGHYDDAEHVFELVEVLRGDGLHERADRLVEYAAERWPDAVPAEHIAEAPERAHR